MNINDKINNITTLASYLGIKDIKKLPAQDRKMIKLALEVKKEGFTEIPKALRNEKKLSLVEKHLEQAHHDIPVLGLEVNKTQNYSKKEVLKKKSHGISSRISRSLKNRFAGRISSQKFIGITKKHWGETSDSPSPLYTRYHSYHAEVEKVEGPESQSIRQAKGGKTQVYLPDKLPDVVLKKSGRKEGIERFHQMQGVRNILKEQKASHLIIPKANLVKGYLVEERLPINVDRFHNIGLYLSDPRAFDDAVREMTRLFSKVTLSDLVNPQLHPISHIKGVGDDIRYDNLPLYVVEENGVKKGKIGLIDLEHMQNKPKPEGLEVLARIFPLHVDIIKEEAKNLKLKVNEKNLTNAAEKGKKYFKGGYTDHLEWIKQKGLTSQPIQVSPEREKELTKLVEKELLKLNQGHNDLFKRQGYGEQPEKNFLTQDPHQSAKTLAASITPIIIDSIKTAAEKKINKAQGKELSESKLVKIRSPLLKRLTLHKEVEKQLLKNDTITFKDFRSTMDVSEQLTHAVLEELVRGGELYSYDPAYYTGGHNLCWIRF